jgi:hypothetical protein
MSPTFRGKKADLKSSINVSQAVCHDWSKHYKRRQTTQFLTIADINCCAAKYYFLWHYDPTPSCKTLGHMEAGRKNAEDIREVLKLADMVTRPYFVGEIANMGKDPIYIISIPDYVDDVPNPNLLINVKTHTVEKRFISVATKVQMAFMGQLGYDIDLPFYYVNNTANPDLGEQNNDAYQTFGRIFPAYIGDMVELMANDQLTRTEDIDMALDTGRLCKIVVLARDGQFEEKWSSDKLTGLWPVFETWLTQVLHAHIQAHKDRRFNQKSFDDLVAIQITNEGILKSYQCKDCPAFSMGMCKGMPPLRKHHLKDDTLDPSIVGIYRSQAMEAFVKYWRSKRYTLPDPPKFTERDTYYNDKADQIGQKGRLTRTQFEETIRWTKEVQDEFISQTSLLQKQWHLTGLGLDPGMEAILKSFIE